MGMQCDDIDAMLIEYLDHKLSPAMRTSIEKHLQTCGSCRQALEEYKTLFNVMQHHKTEQPGPSLHDKFENMLQSEINIDTTEQILQKEREKDTVAIKKHTSWWRIAASIILLAGGILVGMKITPRQQNDNGAQIAKLNKEVQ